MKRRTFQRAVFLLPGIITWGLLSACRGAPKEDVVAPVVTVDVAPVLNAEIQRVIRTQALIYPLQQAAIAPKISAPIKKIYVEKGAAVRAGQLLVELENQDIVGALKESQAARALAEANYETTAGATVNKKKKKAELDVQAQENCARRPTGASSTAVRVCKEAPSLKGRERSTGEPHPGAQPIRSCRQSPRQFSAFRQDDSLRAAGAQRDQASARLGATEAN
jgi:multidrug efflux pump subunit AcrA (membrane-fusion protein)